MPLILNAFKRLLVLLILHFIARSGCSLNGKLSSLDLLLTPYIHGHGSRLNHRFIRDCQRQKHGTEPHELYAAHKSENFTLPFVQISHFVKEVPLLFGTRTIRGHHAVISDPMKTFSILEPNQEGGCSLNIRQTVSETARKHNCILAVNAGYFDTKQGMCLGNVVSNSRKAHNSNGIQNAHFGLEKDGNIFVGYVSEEQYLSNQFKQLVGGVIWILRNGSDFVNVSKHLECDDTEETGTMENFINILSARTSVGHDENGNIVIIQVDGKSGIDGINLNEMQGLLKEFGLINAINLDGGGSSTFVFNGVTVNYPYDACSNGQFSCDRKVSTVLCVHSPYCDPNDCNNHGECIMGACVCKKNWSSPKCDQLLCSQNNCSDHGLCMEHGCLCNPGYYGENCDKICPQGRYGMMCNEHCSCLNQAECHPVTGLCLCNAGFIGDKCQFTCPSGYFGKNCAQRCHCTSQCFCDIVTGSCEINANSSLYIAAKCMLQNAIQEQHLVKDTSSEKRKWYITMIILGIITAVCIAAFLLLAFCSCSCFCRNEQILCKNNVKRRYRKYPLQVPGGDLSDSTSDSESVPMKILEKS